MLLCIYDLSIITLHLHNVNNILLFIYMIIQLYVYIYHVQITAVESEYVILKLIVQRGIQFIQKIYFRNI